MRALFRVAAALLAAIPVSLVLAIVCALAGQRGTALPLGEQGFPPAGERSLAWLLAARKRNDHRGIPLVASACVPGKLPSVVLTFCTGGEMHVQAPFFHWSGPTWAARQDVAASSCTLSASRVRQNHA